MINVWTSIYNTKEELKHNEMMYCLNQNVNNPFIDKIYVLNETDLNFDNPKIENIQIPIRPTYNHFFQFINALAPNDINIITNSDIYFDLTIKLIYDMHESDCYALSRYEDGVLFALKQSQDVWIFKGVIKPITGNFNLGVMGCDNKIAYEIHQAGYNISNPSLSIKCHHVHKSSREWMFTQVPLPGPHLHLDHVSL